MNLKTIKKRIEQIKQKTDDDGVAHSIEDDLYLDFINYVAKNSKNKKIKEMALEVLKTNEISFDKWYD